MIHTSQWVRLRRRKLMACPLCERCKEEGRVTVATEVHHVVPVEDGLSMRERARLMFDYHNLRALCHDCHVKTHTELGRSGKAYAIKVAKEKIKRFKDRFM